MEAVGILNDLVDDSGSKILGEGRDEFFFCSSHDFAAE